ncbi:hypothetical protein ECTW09195_5340, partial [Escherichia coli TW09195]
MFYRGGETRVP